MIKGRKKFMMYQRNKGNFILWLDNVSGAARNSKNTVQEYANSKVWFGIIEHVQIVYFGIIT